MVQMICFTNTNTPNGLAKVSIHRLKKKIKKNPNVIRDSLLILQAVIHSTAKVLSN